MFAALSSLIIGMTRRMEYGGHPRYQIQLTKDHGKERFASILLNKSLNKLLKLIVMIIELSCYPDTAENQEPQL